VFYQYINSKPMLGGTAALIALLIFLIAMKRKKDNDQAAA
jgi:LPXTG-motif cell wall-anchored protein